jgi:hypothetical protein
MPWPDPRGPVASEHVSEVFCAQRRWPGDRRGTQVFTTARVEMNTWLLAVNTICASGCELLGSQVVISRQDLGNAHTFLRTWNRSVA